MLVTLGAGTLMMSGLTFFWRAKPTEMQAAPPRQSIPLQQRRGPWLLRSIVALVVIGAVAVGTVTYARLRRERMDEMNRLRSLLYDDVGASCKDPDSRPWLIPRIIFHVGETGYFERFKFMQSSSGTAPACFTSKLDQLSYPKPLHGRDVLIGGVWPAKVGGRIAVDGPERPAGPGWIQADRSELFPYGPPVPHGPAWVWPDLGALEGGAPCGRLTLKCVFVTSKFYDANLGGLAGADAKCQALADAAALRGTYRAWLSTVSVAAKSRLTLYGLPYVLVDGTVVAWNSAQLTTDDLTNPIALTEQGTAVTQSPDSPSPDTPIYNAWTFTTGTGLPETNSTNDCGGWTNDANANGPFGGGGNPTSPKLFLGWSEHQTTACWILSSLYCFEE